MNNSIDNYIELVTINYTIIGFLCIDSMSIKAFTEAQEAYYVEFAKSYADLFFLF